MPYQKEHKKMELGHLPVCFAVFYYYFMLNATVLVFCF